MSIIYGLFAWIDWAIYSIIGVLFQIIVGIYNVQFFKDGQIDEISNRVYMILGVLMLFKVVISGIQYLVNPDSFSDKEKGFSNLLQKTVVCIGMIVIIPTIFDFAIDIQSKVVESIPSIVLGAENTTIQGKEDEVGQKLAYTTLISFVQDRNAGSDTWKVSGYNEVGDKTIYNLDTFRDHVNEGVGLIDIGKAEFNYMIIISTVAGVFLGYTLLSMALDIAIRTIKLGLIQILAPIPISSYIFGKDKFNKFVKIAIQVYTDLFIRMAIVYFIILAINTMVHTGILDPFAIATNGVSNKVTGNWFFDTTINIVILFGLLMFAKNAPKFITDLLGLPDVGSGDFKDMFKPAWQRAGGAASQLINPFTTAAANYRQAMGMNAHMKDDKHKIASALRRNLNAARRGAAGFARGAADSLQGIGAGENWSQMKSRHDRAVGKSLERAKAQKNKASSMQEGQSRLQRVKDQISAMKAKLGAANTHEVRQEAENRYQQQQQRLRTLEGQIATLPDGSEEKNNAITEYGKLSSQLGDREGWLRNERFKIAAEKRQQSQIDQHNNTISQSEARIRQINNELAGNNLNAQQRAQLEVEKQQLGKTINDAHAAIENITHSDALTNAQNTITTSQNALNAANQRVSQIESYIAGGNGDTTLDNLRAEQTRINSQSDALINSIDQQLSNTNLTASERTRLENQKQSLIQQRDARLAQVNADINNRVNELNTELTTQRETVRISQEAINTSQAEERRINAQIESGFNAIVEEYRTAYNDTLDAEVNGVHVKGTLVKEQDKIEEEIKLAEEAVRRSGLRSSVNAYFGGAPVSGKGYTDLASLLSQSRSSIYTGEAMTKMRQNADILVDVDGKDATFTTKFSNDSSRGYSYQEMANIKNLISTGQLTEERLQKEYAFGSLAIFQSAFEDVEKKAAEAYIDANIAEYEGGEVAANTRYRLKRPEINSAIIEWRQSFKDELVKSGVPGDVIGKLMEEFNRDPGGFIKKGSEYKDLYSRVGKRIVDSAKPSDGGKK